MTTFLSLEMYSAQLLKPPVNIVKSWCKYLHSASACLFFDCSRTKLLETLGNTAVGVFFPKLCTFYILKLKKVISFKELTKTFRIFCAFREQ